MKFVMVTTHYPPEHIGGDAVQAKYLSEELAAQGHEVHVVCSPDVFRALRGRRGADGGHDRPEGITTHPMRTTTARLDIAGAYAFGWSRKSEEFVRGVVAEVRPDVVHWHNTRGFVARPPPIGGVVQLHTAHDYYDVCPRADLLRPGGTVCGNPRLCTVCTLRRRRIPQLWRAGGARVVRFPDGMKIICPSEFMLRRLGEDGIRNTHLVRNFVPRPGSRSTRSDGDRKSLLYLGILEKHKGPHTLIDAFAKSATEHEFDLVVVGKGSMREELERRTSDLGMNGRVRFAGYLPTSELEAVFERTAYMVVPSEWHENAPLTVLESLSRGVPVLGSRIGGVPEILTEDSGSLTFEPGRPLDLAATITRAWSLLDELPSRSEDAMRCYEEKFSPERYMRDYLGIVEGHRE